MQPFHLGNDMVVCNGEIYGFRAVRAELSHKYAFVSSSDCKALLPMYREYGLSMVEKPWFWRQATPAQKTLVMQRLRQTYPLAALLSIAQIAHATYYYYAKAQTAPDKYAVAKEEIGTIYHEHKGRYGYRRITMELFDALQLERAEHFC